MVYSLKKVIYMIRLIFAPLLYFMPITVFCGGGAISPETGLYIWSALTFYEVVRFIVKNIDTFNKWLEK